MFGYDLLQFIVAVVAFGALLRLALAALHRFPWLQLRLRQAFLIRFSLITGFLLLGLWPLSEWGAPDMLANLFVLDGPLELFNITWASVLVAASVLITARVTLENAEERFTDYASLLRKFENQQVIGVGLHWGWKGWLWFCVGGLVVPTMCLLVTVRDDQLRWTSRTVFELLGGIALGLLAALCWLILVAAIQQWFLPAPAIADRLLPLERLSHALRKVRFRCVERLDKKMARFFRRLGPGYADPTVDQLKPGHAQNFLFILAYVVFYLATYGWAQSGNWKIDEGNGFPPLFFVLLLVLVLGFLLTSLAFFLDYFRIPTLIAAGVISYVFFRFSNTDHYYVLHPDIHEYPTLLTWVVLVAACLALAGLAWSRHTHPIIRTGYRLAVVALLLGLDSALLKRMIGWGIQEPGLPLVSVIVVLGAAVVVLLASALLIIFVPRKRIRPVRRALGLAGVTLTIVAGIALQAAYSAQWINALPKHAPVAQIPDFLGVSKQWATPEVAPGRSRTLVIVTAAGGGIQASAWTARVLTGLHERFGPKFSRSIGLISSVSGGSLGTAYYLSQWKENDDPLDDSAIAQINEMARRSSLEAGAWGIAYPDFLRLCFAPLISPNADRGTAVEEAWRRNLRRCQPPRDDWRLMELSDPIRRGRMPPVVFNATIAETGQRLLISPILNEPMTREQFVRGAFLNPPGAVEFMRLFDNAESDLRVSTAVRLSAAFPFVSPIARARRENTRPSSERWAALKPKVRAFFNEFNDWERTEGRREFLKNCHVVDGGYVDNEGAFTAIQWVNSLLKYYSDESTAKSRPFDRIVFLRIMPFPPEQARGTDSQDWSPDKEGWANEFTGPLSALASVRTTSQLDRNSFSLGVLESSANKTETTRIGERVQQISKELGDRARVPSSPASRGNPLPQPIQERLENEVWAAARAGDARPASLPPITVERIQFVFQLFDGDRPIAQHITPLSWKLTAQEKKDIDAAWEAISRHHEQDHRPLDEKKQTDPLAVLDEYFILRRK